MSAGFQNRRPLALACGILMTKGVVCDTLVQKTVEKRDEMDWKRTAVLGTYGGFCEAPLAYMTYSKLFPLLFGGPRYTRGVVD